MPAPTPPVVFVDLLEVVYKSPKSGRPQRWRWVAKNGNNNKILAKSSENYTNRQDALDAITQLFGTRSNVYLRAKEQGDLALRSAVAW